MSNYELPDILLNSGTFIDSSYEFLKDNHFDSISSLEVMGVAYSFSSINSFGTFKHYLKEISQGHENMGEGAFLFYLDDSLKFRNSSFHRFTIVHNRDITDFLEIDFYCPDGLLRFLSKNSDAKLDISNSDNCKGYVSFNIDKHKKINFHSSKLPQTLESTLESA